MNKESTALLEEYTKWLVENGYCDDDVWSESPGAVDRFIAEKTKK